MFYRQKLLLSLLEELKGAQKGTDFQKLLFLFTQECQSEKSYEFVPYNYGCFSFQSYSDKAKLVQNNVLKDTKDWCILKKDFNYSDSLKASDSLRVKSFAKKYSSLRGKKLLKYVYEKYPYYASRSIVAKDILSEADFEVANSSMPTFEEPVFATIGYEGNSIENYVNKLLKNGINSVIDVRKNPLSRKYGFSKTKMSEILGKLGISYFHMPALGILSDKRKSLNTMKDYNELFQDYEDTVLKTSEDALDELHSLYLDKRRIAITCFEESHTMCHRGRIAKRIHRDHFEDVVIAHL